MQKLIEKMFKERNNVVFKLTCSASCKKDFKEIYDISNCSVNVLLWKMATFQFFCTSGICQKAGTFLSWLLILCIVGIETSASCISHILK